VRGPAQRIKTFFLFDEQLVYFLYELHQSSRILFRRGLFTQLNPTFPCFPLHGGKYLDNS
jgi:hypothetical protein